MPELRKNRSGYYEVGFYTDTGTQWRSTGAKTHKDALVIVEKSGIKELELAAQAKALTSESLSAIMAGRKVTCSAALDEWISWAKSQSTAPNTIDSRILRIQSVIDSHKLANKPVTAITEDIVNNYVNNKGAMSKNNRLNRLSALRSFFTMCSARGYCIGNPTLAVKVNHRLMTHEEKETKSHKPFTKAEYDLIVRSTEGWWNWAVQLAWWTGLRLIDICTLDWSSLKDGQVIVHTLKRDVRIKLPINHKIVGGGVLSLVLLEMSEHRTKGTTLCFPEIAADALNPKKRSKFSQAFGRILTRLGIEDRTFHSFRHAFATRLSEDEKMTIDEIAEAIGHQNTKTTAGYITTRKPVAARTQG